MSQAIQQTQSAIAARASALLREQQQANFERTDRAFAVLLIVQWAAAMVAAWWISPRTWSGAFSSPHLHVWAAVFFGGMITISPVFLTIRRPGHMLTRHIVAVSQVLMSSLLIHLSGGRIETHFHVFGSLAFLACYRDWRVLISATAVVAVDHLARGVYWPQSVYGVLTTTIWRSLEHAGWVIFEDVFLIIMIRRSVREMGAVALHRAELEATNSLVEAEVNARTRDVFKAMEGAKQANQAKSEFLANISHELRTPLHSILSFARFGVDEYRDGEREELLEYYQKIAHSGDTLLALVNDLLDLAKLESGKMTIEQQPCDLAELIVVVVDEFRSLCSERELTICCDDRQLAVNVCCDKARIEQVVRNLLSNAAKFSPQGGSIYVSGELLQNSVRIAIRDEGPGIPSEELESVFDKFIQSSKTRTGAGGTGLGLAICRQIIDAHQGRIWAENNLQGGAVFCVELPGPPTIPATATPSNSIVEDIATAALEEQTV